MRYEPLRHRGLWGGRKFGCRDDPEARAGFRDPHVHEGGAFYYYRPALPEYLAGEKALKGFTLHDGAWYEKNRIDVHLSTEIVRIDPGARTVTTKEGQDLCLRPASSGDGRQGLASGHQGRRCTGRLHAQDPGRCRCHPEARRVGKIRRPHRRRPSGPRGGKRAAQKRAQGDARREKPPNASPSDGPGRGSAAPAQDGGDGIFLSAQREDPGDRPCGRAIGRSFRERQQRSRRTWSFFRRAWNLI